MAAQIRPVDAVPANSTCFPQVTLNHPETLMAVAGSIDGTADVSWDLVFDVPAELPSGTPKLDLYAHANSTSQVIRIQALWIAVNKTAARGGTKSGEGQQDITLSGTALTPVGTKITLDATTAPAAGQRVEMRITFYGTHANWTCNVNSLYKAFLIWE